MMPKNPIFCALDTSDLDQARRLARAVSPHVGGLKLGLEFFLAHGPAGVRAVCPPDIPLFLDLKLYDIPNTVAGAVASILPLEPAFLTLHASGGPAMIAAAHRRLEEVGSQTKLLAVTVLTSMTIDDLAVIGIPTSVEAQVERLACMAPGAGAHGLVCSAWEVENLRYKLGPKPVLMVPGIRPEGADVHDQARIMTPKDAMAAGADYLVIGRPITQAPDPGQAAADIKASLGQ